MVRKDEGELAQRVNQDLKGRARVIMDRCERPTAEEQAGGGVIAGRSHDTAVGSQYRHLGKPVQPGRTPAARLVGDRRGELQRRITLTPFRAVLGDARDLLEPSDPRQLKPDAGLCRRHGLQAGAGIFEGHQHVAKDVHGNAAFGEPAVTRLDRGRRTRLCVCITLLGSITYCFRRDL